jgi:hypothetical protein
MFCKDKFIYSIVLYYSSVRFMQNMSGKEFYKFLSNIFRTYDVGSPDSVLALLGGEEYYSIPGLEIYYDSKDSYDHFKLNPEKAVVRIVCWKGQLDLLISAKNMKEIRIRVDKKKSEILSSGVAIHSAKKNMTVLGLF